MNKLLQCRWRFWLTVACLLTPWSVLGAAELCCNLKPDEQIVFFPALGSRAPGRTGWQAQVRGCVFEPEKRGVALALLSQGLRLQGVKMSEPEQAMLRERARLFLVDSERGKRVVIRAGDCTFRLGKSAADGTFSGSIEVPAATVERLGTNLLVFHAVLPPGDSRNFCGKLIFVAEAGLTVISDVDDTIKMSNVRDRDALLRNSFLEPFRAVQGMAGLYSSWATNSGAQFFYVSASPEQFYSPLSEFAGSNGFPEGLYCLKYVRWKNKSLLGLFQNPEDYKLRTIQPLLERFSARRFILVGDSGERDPEIYAALARRFPRQIGRILIRDVTGEVADSPRYQQVFRDVPPGLWQVFREAESVRQPLP